MRSHLHTCQAHLDTAGIALANACSRMKMVRTSIAAKHAPKLDSILNQLNTLQDEISESLEIVEQEMEAAP